ENVHAHLHERPRAVRGERRETSTPDITDFLRHEYAGCPRRITWNAAEFPPAMALVKPWRLEVDRIEHGSAAAAPHRLFLCDMQHASANLLPAQALREEHEIDKQEAKGGPSQYAPDDPMAHGVANKHCKRVWVPIARVLRVVAPELVIDQLTRLAV